MSSFPVNGDKITIFPDLGTPPGGDEGESVLQTWVRDESWLLTLSNVIS